MNDSLLDTNLDRVVADRQLLSDLTTVRERVQRDRELDELFADADVLLDTFDEKILD